MCEDNEGGLPMPWWAMSFRIKRILDPIKGCLKDGAVSQAGKEALEELKKLFVRVIAGKRLVKEMVVDTSLLGAVSFYALILDVFSKIGISNLSDDGLQEFLECRRDVLDAFLNDSRSVADSRKELEWFVSFLEALDKVAYSRRKPQPEEKVFTFGYRDPW